MVTPLETKRTPIEWLQAAVDARELAAALADEEANVAWERFAEECEATARTALKPDARL